MAFKSSFKNSAGGGSVSVSVSGIDEGDFILLTVPVDGSSATINWPSGFTNETKVGSGSPDSLTFAINWKYAGASEPSSYAINNNNSPSLLIVTVLSGREGSPTISTATQNTSSNSTPVSATWNGVTATAGADIILTGGGDATSGSAIWTFTAPTDYTLQEDYFPQEWLDAFTAYRENVSAGATGSLATTITRVSGSGNIGYTGYTVSVPAAASGTVALTGTAVSSALESELKSGGQTLVVTLADETFIGNS